MKNLTQILGLEEGSFTVKDNYLYLPLMYDSDVVPNDDVRTIRGKPYARSINLLSIVENYEQLVPRDYSAVKKEVLEEVVGRPVEEVAVRDGIKETLFQILPRFVKINKGIERKKPTNDEIMDFVETKYKIPEEYYKRAGGGLRTQEDLAARIAEQRIDTLSTIYSVDVNQWFARAVRAHILNQAKQDVTKAFAAKTEQERQNVRYNAFLLYMNDQRNFEIDDFGFTFNDGYLFVYKRLPEYVLKDFDGELYLFPGCRVGGYFHNPNEPKVVERGYKHPFVSGGSSFDRVCTGVVHVEGRNNLDKTIDAIEKGTVALLYGYFNKYFFDSGAHGMRDLRGNLNGSYTGVNFRDYRITRDHPKLKSGAVQITNDALVKA